MSNASSRQQTPDIQPVIAELLRTCVHPPVLPLQIDHIVRKPAGNGASEDPACRSYVTKLFLTDGQLLIQALLHRKLSTLPEIEDLGVGDVVEIHDFVVRKAKRRSGRGHVVYLGVDNCYVIKKENKAGSGEKVGLTTSASPTRGKRGLNSDKDYDSKSEDYEDEMPGGFFKDVPMVSTPQNGGENHSLDSQSPNQPLRHESSSLVPSFAPPSSSNKRRRHIMIAADSDSDSENGFETAIIDVTTVKRRRQVLRELDRNIVSTPVRSPTREHVLPTKVGMSEAYENLTGQTSKNASDPSTTINRCDDSITLVTDAEPLNSHPSQTPSLQLSSWGPFRPLASLYSPSLPAKSFILSTLVVPTYVSSHLISRPNSPLPAKRHVKIIDISLASRLKIGGSKLLGRGITVSVFRDAPSFKPTVGHVALLRGLVMQRLKNGEVILNVYPEKSRIQIQSQTRSQSQVMDWSRPPSRHAHFADNPVMDIKRELEGKSLIPRSREADRSLKGNASERETTSDTSWFIDDHEKLRNLGYDVDGIQQWWDGNVHQRS